MESKSKKQKRLPPTTHLALFNSYSKHLTLFASLPWLHATSDPSSDHVGCVSNMISAKTNAKTNRQFGLTFDPIKLAIKCCFTICLNEFLMHFYLHGVEPLDIGLLVCKHVSVPSADLPIKHIRAH